MLLLLPLSTTFLRLSDSRAGVLVIPLVALAMWLAIEPLGRDRLRRVVVLALTVAAAVLVHPLLGIYGAAFLAMGAALRPSAHAGHVWPALAVAAILVAPQLALGASLTLPPWSVLLPIPLALAVAYGASALSPRLPVVEIRLLPVLTLAALAVVVLIVVVERPQSIPAIGRMVWRDNGYPAIVAASVLALLLTRRRGAELIAATVITTAAIAAVAHIVPLAWAIRPTIFAEAPKFVYLTPTLLTLAAAGGIAALWAVTSLPLAIRGVVIALLLVFAAAPVGSTPTSAFSLGEHRWAESVSIAWRNAAQGALRGLPDWRRMIDGPQTELVARLRAEIAVGQITATTPVLQVASDQAIWEATPLAVFTGAMVTSVTPDPDRSQHSVGGRLHAITELPELLGPSYPYVVYEPAELEPGIRDLIVEAGYGSIFANSRGEIFRLTVAGSMAPPSSGRGPEAERGRPRR